MTVAGSAPLVVASNRGPISIVPVEDGDDEIRRGGGGLVSGMQAALAATPDAVWICAALNDRERSLARRAVSGRLSAVPEGLQRNRERDPVVPIPHALRVRAVAGLRSSMATVLGRLPAV